jgi:hypothetical protein
MQPILQQPYTQTLSMLRKIDLMRLSLEFRLPTDGSVVTLRNRLRVYLNAHSETLFRNPRYRPLYPKIRRQTNPPEPVFHDSQTIPSSSSRSSRSVSPASSYESWNGIEADAFQLPPPAIQPPPLAVLPPAIQPPPLAVLPPHNPAVQYPPPPPPSSPGSDPEPLPFGNHDDDGRKFFHLLSCSHHYPFLLFPTLLWYPISIPPLYCGIIIILPTPTLLWSPYPIPGCFYYTLFFPIPVSPGYWLSLSPYVLRLSILTGRRLYYRDLDSLLPFAWLVTAPTFLPLRVSYL